MNVIVKTASVVAVLAIAATAATASAQTAPDPLLTRSFEELADHFGDQDGHVWVKTATGRYKILARGQSSYVVYTGGDSVYAADDFAYCYEDAQGKLSACDPAGGTSGFTCGDGFCKCSGVFDCADLIISNQCTIPIWCDGTACTCAY
jgi:hypothetical protein